MPPYRMSHRMSRRMPRRLPVPAMAGPQCTQAPSQPRVRGTVDPSFGPQSLVRSAPAGVVKTTQSPCCAVPASATAVPSVFKKVGTHAEQFDLPRLPVRRARDLCSMDGMHCAIAE